MSRFRGGLIPEPSDLSVAEGGLKEVPDLEVGSGRGWTCSSAHVQAACEEVFCFGSLGAIEPLTILCLLSEARTSFHLRDVPLRRRWCERALRA